jgi:S-adenosylmethionine hydrolase
MARPIITLLTDFGLKDYYVGAIKGVLLGICPEACLVDLSHEVEPFNIPQAAWILSQTWQCFPSGTVHLVVVDPGVGSARRPVAARAGGHLFVAPDNGVLTFVLDADPECRVYDIEASGYFRQPVSHTFHGRDIFAPVAAHLAAGLAIQELGVLIKDYHRINLGIPINSEPDSWVFDIVTIDNFGNIITNLDWESFQWVSRMPFEMRIGSRAVTTWRDNYSEAAGDEPFVTRGSAGFLEVSINQRDASILTGVKGGMRGELRKL